MNQPQSSYCHRTHWKDASGHQKRHKNNNLKQNRKSRRDYALSAIADAMMAYIREAEHPTRCQLRILPCTSNPLPISPDWSKSTHYGIV